MARRETERPSFLSLVHILAFTVVALAGGLIGRGRWRSWLILAASVVGVFWLQPVSPIRGLDFWLSIATLGLSLLTWAVVRHSPDGARMIQRGDLVALAVIGGLIIAISLTRYVDPLCCLTASRPPQVTLVLPVLAAIAGAGWIAARLLAGRGAVVIALIAVLLGVLIMLKLPALALGASAALRSLSGQSASLASPLDIRWLGVSYIFFRLIHILRDKQIGTLPPLSLPEFFSYVIFFPTLTAGPIDRAERFVKDLRVPFAPGWLDLYDGARRIVTGLFLKFALADSLALVALDGARAALTSDTIWLWVLLYAYAFRLYFDFAGYSAIAIGIGRLMGFRIPENFNRPYLKPDLTAFWNSWHMTLAQWFRAYWFNPLSRALRSGPARLPAWAMIALSQFTTMILIGLWHGLTWNFVIWGAWHGIGLFVHNRWSVLTRPVQSRIARHPLLTAALSAAGVALTFNYVALGWVWFALPDVGLSWRVMLRLVGIA